jgi:Brp/Blh family beta-carotene 15,15'-monooxygenase
MKNYTNIAVVVSFVALWIISFLSSKNQIIAGFILILTFGILHGSNDLELLDKMMVKKNIISTLRVTIYYVGFILLGAVLFYLLPLLSLITFIVVSSFHFGEQQWQNLPQILNRYLIYSYQFLSGFIILLLIFVFHTKQVQDIIFIITNHEIPLEFSQWSLVAFGSVFVCLSAYFYWKSKEQQTEILVHFFRLIILTIIFKSASLIWGFAIYFVIWHSIPSTLDQVIYLYDSISRKHFVLYFKKAGLNWLISVVSVVVLYLFFKEEQLFNAVFFSFLAAITFPHAVVIATMFREK